MKQVFLVGCGGFAGASLRYLCALWIGRYHFTFPLATLAVNVAGAFLIGFFSSLFAAPGQNALRLFLTTGVMGGFTTFSTFSLETVNLLEDGRIGMAGANILVSVGCCLCGVLLGKAAAGRLAA